MIIDEGRRPRLVLLGRKNVDSFATGLMTGGDFEDGSDRGFVARNTTGDGACSIIRIASSAFGMKRKSKRGVLAYALPIRAACLKTSLANMKTMLSGRVGVVLPHFARVPQDGARQGVEIRPGCPR